MTPTPLLSVDTPASPPPARLRYALVTPARNEAGLIEATIRCVIAQSQRPERWVIVSDGSTDGTDDIVARHAAEHDWIRLLRRTPDGRRSFAGKAHAFNAGHALLASVAHEVVGSLDADITLGTDHFEFLLERFAQDAGLGVAGTPFCESGSHYDYRYTDIAHVSGACQMFRRACFDELGGFEPIPGGGIDWVAVTTARMHGWRTRTFCERVCHHHRPMGSAQASTLAARFRMGRKDYALGGHPLWQVFRSVYQMRARPRVLGGALLMLGYAWAWASRQERTARPALVAFHRHEQLARLRAALHLSRIGGWRRNASGASAGTSAGTSAGQP